MANQERYSIETKVQGHPLALITALILASLLGFPGRACAANPVPFINAFSPLGTAGPGFTLTVSGVGFVTHLTLDCLGSGYTLLAGVTTVAGTFTAVSNPFNELCMGDPCLAPEALLNGCVDTDGDGLPDAWEIAGGIDVTGDGKISSQYDVLLPGANSKTADVYLHYDYTYAIDHDHKPAAVAIQYVVDAFAVHGVSLRIDPQHSPISEAIAKVVSLSNQNTIANFVANPACVGPTGMSMHQLRQQTNFGVRKVAYHYIVFSHYSECDPTLDPATSQQYCNACSPGPHRDLCGPELKPQPGNPGSAEIVGDDAIVATAGFTDVGLPVTLEAVAGLAMHELGHNLGLLHGGADCRNNKPNYVSVMNYNFNASVIPVAGAAGSIMPLACTTDAGCPSRSYCSAATNTCFRIDYRDSFRDTGAFGLASTHRPPPEQERVRGGNSSSIADVRRCAVTRQIFSDV